MMLPSDLALIEDPAFKKYVELFAKDEDLFFKGKYPSIIPLLTQLFSLKITTLCRVFICLLQAPSGRRARPRPQERPAMVSDLPCIDGDDKSAKKGVV